MASHLDRIVYLNGEFLLARDAKVSIFDRGLLFADSVYEGLGVLDGRIIDFDMHMTRLRRSLRELSMPATMTDAEIYDVLSRLVRDNGFSEGFLYLHVTRGEADRDYVYTSDLKPTVFAFTQSTDKPRADAEPQGISMVSQQDLRWRRRDIKSTNLLGQVIAKQAAHDAGAYEALLVDDDGYVNEGGATSFFIVRDGTLFVRPVTNDILHGVTRQAMLKVAEQESLKIETRRFTLEEACAADEAFLTGSSTYIEPVIRIDGQTIGTGEPGPVTLKLRSEYLSLIRRG